MDERHTFSEMPKQSKSVKKNKKRNAKKSTNGSAQTNSTTIGVSHREILDQLQCQLDQAKADRDFSAQKLLREEIWVMSDMLNGVKTNISAERIQLIKARIPGLMPIPEPEHDSSASIVTLPDKRIRNLRKRILQIEELEKKKATGQSLETLQMKKIESRKDVEAEIAELEALFNSIK